jgi:hypothetical protein
MQSDALTSLKCKNSILMRAAGVVLSPPSSESLLELHTLELAYTSASSDTVRRQLIHGGRVLGKWDTLAFLLPPMETKDVEFAGAEINREGVNHGSSHCDY